MVAKLSRLAGKSGMQQMSLVRWLQVDGVLAKLVSLADTLAAADSVGELV